MSSERDAVEAILRREWPRLLEQHRGKYVIVTPEGIHSIWDTSDDAVQALVKFRPHGTAVLRCVATEEEANAAMEYGRLWNVYCDADGKVGAEHLAEMRKTWGMLNNKEREIFPTPPWAVPGQSLN